MSEMRKERDSMGEMEVPADALYGASTQRAVLNFPISGHAMPPPFIRGLALVKWACSGANEELARLVPEKAELIRRACEEIMTGKHDAHFPVDVFQTGSGTSSNMNLNEVVANLASLAAGKTIGSREPVHPNDDVNLGQSSNDIIPTALHVSVAMELRKTLVPGLIRLAESLEERARAFAGIVKIGRTHLMDATPLTLGQEVSGHAAQVRKAVARAEKAVACLEELAVGGTAVGTGINGHPEFAAAVCRRLADRTGIPFREAENHFEAQGARDDAVEVAGHLSTIAGALTKVANDIRLLGSGPRAGLGELILPATQPGSSIMPGKVNPVMSEMLVQASMYTMGLSHAVVLGGRDGHLELNVTIPLMAHCLHESIRVLGNAAAVFAERCVDGLQADEEACRRMVDRSLMLVTALNPYIGYDNAARVAKKAFEENTTLRQAALDMGLLDETTLDQALDPRTMIEPGG